MDIFIVVRVDKDKGNRNLSVHDSRAGADMHIRKILRAIHGTDDMNDVCFYVESRIVRTM